MDSAEPKKMDDVPARHEQEFTAKPDNIPVDITAEQNGKPQQGDGDRKRKRDSNDHERGSRRGDKRKDMGRTDWQRNATDRRSRTEQERKQNPDKPSVLPAAFAKEEVEAEDRRPKRKVAVMVGYSGTGYKGMQISGTEKTIEGDLFTAFVKAGAISKANADDPKKSGLVRCARTDKGVHAAGNMISLKLIIEEDDIVDKINEALDPRIRVWGIERTIGSFSCYQACDSRWYEYLLPTHALLPPHPSCFLAKKVEEAAVDAGDKEAFDERQSDVKGFWDEVEEKDIKPILDALDPEIRDLCMTALYMTEDYNPNDPSGTRDRDVEQAADINGSARLAESKSTGVPNGHTEDAAIVVNEPALHQNDVAKDEIQPSTDTVQPAQGATERSVALPSTSVADDAATSHAVENSSLSPEKREALSAAIKQLKTAYDAAKRRWRIPKSRIERLQSALSLYTGTKNFHNYTVQKTFNDKSSRRHIKSFLVNTTPIIINGTEWLSLKVHGQSFMMHQIRKMVGMASLIVRCGAPTERITQSYESDKWSIPKVPGLGLLLERPVFDSYNNLQASKHGREKLDFGKHDDKIEAFKRTEIYQKIFEDEARENTFHQFFNHIDNYRQPHFLYLTSWGFEGTKREVRGGIKSAKEKFEEDSDDEGADKADN